MTQLVVSQRERLEASATAQPVTFSPSLVTIHETTGKSAEAIRALRTHLMAQHFQQGRRALAICGPSAGVGCTFTAANVAVALSQIGMGTLLIDADLRRPSVDQIIQPARPLAGLRQCLEDTGIGFEECIEREVLPQLSVMFAGGVAANPQELLASERFQAVMEYCLLEYDATVIDTAPANTCSDARRVSTVAGYAVIVARRDETFVDDVKTLTSELLGDHATVVGTVLNGA